MTERTVGPCMVALAAVAGNFPDADAMIGERYANAACRTEYPTDRSSGNVAQRK